MYYLSKDMKFLPCSNNILVITDGRWIFIALYFDSSRMRAPYYLLVEWGSTVSCMINFAKGENIPVVDDALLAEELYYDAVPGQMLGKDYYRSIATIIAEIVVDNPEEGRFAKVVSDSGGA